MRGGTVRDYLRSIREVGTVAGATEHTYRAALTTFLTKAADELGFGAIAVRSELRLASVGQPDLQVVDAAGSAIGYGETKTPGTAARFADVLESEQVSRYRATLENLLVTDFLRITLFRPEVGRLDVVLSDSTSRLAAGEYAVSAATLAQLSQVLSAFFSATAPAATSAEMLAGGLARRATLLRDAIRELLKPGNDEGDALRKLWDFYRRTLMSDMESDDFADTYAQTLTYSLFLARLEAGPIRDLDAAWKAIPEDIPILRSAIEPLRVQGAFPAPMTVWLTDQLHLLASTPDGVISSIGHPIGGSPDPILYFYEHFLTAYDKVERVRKGVYYTPRPLVDYLVRAVHESLKRDFGRPLGLADKDVRLLDPAVGTGTFPLAAAQVAVDEIASTLGPGAIRTVLEDHVLQHFFGFELLPAPYTISHVKFALFARDHHVRFLKQRAAIYLTNTLGDPLARADDGGLLAFFVPGLIEEAHAAERVKSDEQVLVVIGNPPWSATSHNRQPEIERLFAAWKTIDGQPGSPPIPDARIALNDDYLKFMRWAIWKLFEQPDSPKHGILAFVTNHGFINGGIHRGIRKALLDTFDEIRVFNLQGNQRLWIRGVKDEKVFPDVQQGVAMTVFIKRPGEGSKRASVHYREMRGTRAEKYTAASSIRLSDPGWTQVVPAAPYWSFAPSEGGEAYDAWPSVARIFPTSSSGVQSSRDDLVNDSDRGRLESRMRAIVDPANTDDELRERFDVAENARWRWKEHRAAFSEFKPARLIPWTYRLFDRRFIYWDPALVSWPRQRLMQHLLPIPLGLGGEDRLALIVQRARPINTIATMSRGIAASHVTGHWCHVYPLHLAVGGDQDALIPADEHWRENVDPAIASALAAAHGARHSVEDMAMYTLAILSSPLYRSRFSESLEQDHPHIPFPRDRGAFDRMAELGRLLASAHLLEAPIDEGVRFAGDGDSRVSRIRYDAATETAWVNERQHFTGVTRAAWDWGGAFRPIEHFLADRQDRQLDLEQIEMFMRAVTAVLRTMELEPDLDINLDAIVGATLEFPASNARLG